MILMQHFTLALLHLNHVVLHLILILQNLLFYVPLFLPLVLVFDHVANLEKTKVQGEEKEVRKKADSVKLISDEAQRDLDVAMPA
jgi:hypothetical protein